MGYPDGESILNFSIFTLTPQYLPPLQSLLLGSGIEMDSTCLK